MQFQLSRFEYVKYVEFVTSSPLLNVERIRYFKEFELSGNIVSKQFSYSWDGVVWTNWNTLTQGNLSSLEFRDRPFFHLKVRYNRNGIGSGNIQGFYIFYDSSTPTPPVPPSDPSIDAQTFGGQPPAYYLNRENHFGPYTDLLVSNVPDGNSVGVYSHRLDTSAGTHLYFKRIEGKGGISVTEESNGKIIIDASGISGGATYQNPNPTSSAVGGIPDGSTFFASEKTFADVMQAMFFPVLFPSFTNPSNSFSRGAAYLQIIGNSITIPFTSSFNRGSINPAYGTNGFRSGPGHTVLYTGTGLPSSVSTSISPNTQNITGYVVSIGVQTWSSAWSYNAGQQPKDSEGNDYMSPWPAGTTGHQTASIEGVYPLFAKTEDITTFTKQSPVSMITGNNIVFSMVAESGGNKKAFEIPLDWEGSPTNRPLQGIQTFNTISNTWEYQGGTAATSLTFWDTYIVTNLSSMTQYTRYTYNGTDRSSIQIRLRF